MIHVDVAKEKKWTMFKICSKCGREHLVTGCPSSAEYMSMWSNLKLVGLMDDGVEVLELRNCVCGTTLAVVVRASETEQQRYVRQLQETKLLGA